MADVALLHSVITGRGMATAVFTQRREARRVPRVYFKDLDPDTKAVTDAALDKLKAAGATIVEVDMPDLQKLNDAASFPVALYEAYDDLRTYLAKYRTGKTIEQVAEMIASKDVKGTYDGLVIPRKLPGPNGLVDAAPLYKAAIAEARPALSSTSGTPSAKVDALIAPTTPAVAVKQGPEASSLPIFLQFIRNTDPGSNAGIPGLTIPAGLGPITRLPIGLSLDGPSGVRSGCSPSA